MKAFIKFITDDFYIAIPMFLMMLIGIVLVIWRWLLYYNTRTKMQAFLPEFQDILKKDGIAPALEYCQDQHGMIPSKLYASGLEVSSQGITAMKRAMASTLELEILPHLNFLLPPILAIAKIATMVGLLGTVISMINTFTAISDPKAGGGGSGVTAQASAIGLALFATALGLMTAIPLVFTHVLFKEHVARSETNMKAAAQRLIVLFQNTKPKPGTPRKKPDPLKKGEKKNEVAARTE